MSAEEDVWDGLFHGCAWAAFLEEAVAQCGWPDREATRQRAYRLYEEALAEKNGRAADPLKVDVTDRCRANESGYSHD